MPRGHKPESQLSNLLPSVSFNHIKCSFFCVIQNSLKFSCILKNHIFLPRAWFSCSSLGTRILISIPGDLLRCLENTDITLTAKKMEVLLTLRCSIGIEYERFLFFLNIYLRERERVHTWGGQGGIESEGEEKQTPCWAGSLTWWGWYKDERGWISCPFPEIMTWAKAKSWIANTRRITQETLSHF